MTIRTHLPGGAQVWWVIINIVGLGSPYFLKLVIMKAMIDAHAATADGTNSL